MKSTFRRFCFIISGILLASSSLNGQPKEVRIFGHAPEYSKMAIVFEYYQNFLNYDKKELITVQINEEGNFNFSFPLNKITYAFSDLGRFRGFLYLEPGQEYELELPPFEPLTQSEKLNPFYQPEEILLGIANKDGNSLNPLIRDFNRAFDYQFNTNALKLLTTKNKQLTSTIIDSLEMRFPDEKDFFQAHKHFKYARLAMLTSRNPEKEIIGKYFYNRPVYFSLPAYWHTFKDVFSGYERQLKKKLFKSDSLNIQSLISSIQSDTLIKKTDLAEAVAVFSLHRSYHEKVIPEKTALKLLNQLKSQASIPEVKAIASSLYSKISALRTGMPAPEFTLYNFEGEDKSLEDYKGKFVYINFCHTDNYACQRDLRLLPKLHETFKRDLEIVTIIINNDFEEAKNFIEAHKNLNWEFLFFGMKANIIKDYNVRAVPLYYLINPDGQLVLSPAPSPNENFHDRFIEKYRDYRRQLQRKNPRENRSIFGP
ncbi:TlpA family protein disulfide reductase [Marinilabilia rubra]|uniref:TlpA family protein disulfide reductase n=1 Tax=Marinilabilia rubra TaxID=2162893 RepID=A0A2U2BDM9_9BACT|nr:TlpA disulfide reductase family protein [Marinilabilia rubra]PWE01176.1 TlpA family protein disulfide reductase [Marinilabilia rubra]